MAARRRDRSSEFPILKSKTYLCSHSLGAVPATTMAALKEYYDAWASHGIQAWEGPWWDAVTGFCADAERILGAPKQSVAPLPNATRAMAAIAGCIDYSGARNRVVMTDLEFTTFYPFWRAQERRGAKIQIVPSKDGISVPTNELVAAIDKRTALVATCHAFFRSGAVQDLRAIVAAAHDEDALVMGDGYQAVGAYPVDVKRLDVDFYIGGSHKYLCGGPGAGFLYVRPDLLPDLRPELTGWFGLPDPFAYIKDISGAQLHEGVMRFLDGTIAIPALYAAREGLRAVLAEGVDAIRANSVNLTTAAMARADEIGLQVRTPRTAAERSGMVCLQFEGSQQATRRLLEQGIIVDWRAECGLRMSPHFYNDASHVDRFFDALEPMVGARRPIPKRR